MPFIKFNQHWEEDYSDFFERYSVEDSMSEFNEK